MKGVMKEGQGIGMGLKLGRMSALESEKGEIVGVSVGGMGDDTGTGGEIVERGQVGEKG